MNKFIKWLKSPASDFVLLCIILVLINIISARAFLRLDFTQQRTYSLSESSKQTVKTLTEPLSINVFFSDNLPSGYTKVPQYVKDILAEYKGAGNKNFNVTYYNMAKPENEKIAQGYGLHKIQIQEVKNNEVGFKQVWMGIAITYGDTIEVLDSITSEQGFEYNLTTKISKAISTTDALAGLSSGDNITLTLYQSDDLAQFRINGFDKVSEYIQEAFNTVNKKNMNRMSYIKRNPSSEEIDEIAGKYGLQTFNWENKDKSVGVGTFGLVIEHGDNFRTIPLSIVRSLFGYQVSGLDNLEASISDSLQALLSKTTQIGYLTGHNEASLEDQNGEKIHLDTLLSDMYTLKELKLEESDIPANINSIIINGPKTELTEAELYKLDQFVMKGGNLIIFTDPFNVVQENYYSQPVYTPINNGLNKILGTYGINLPNNYVFDEQCYVARQQAYGTIKMYWAPQLQRKDLNQKNVITKNLGYVIMLQPGSVDVSNALANKELKTSILAKTSKQGWIETDNFEINPNMQAPYDKTRESVQNLVALVEGRFTSAYDSNPLESADSKNGLTASNHIKFGTQKAKIFVCNTAYVTSNQLIDENGTQPIAMMIRNAVDYMNGNSDLCTMRTKGLTLNTLNITNGKMVRFVEVFCILGLMLIVALFGVLALLMRQKHKRAIHFAYNPNDQRDSSTANLETKEEEENND